MFSERDARVTRHLAIFAGDHGVGRHLGQRLANALVQAGCAPWGDCKGTRYTKHIFLHIIFFFIIVLIGVKRRVGSAIYLELISFFCKVDAAHGCPNTSSPIASPAPMEGKASY